VIPTVTKRAGEERIMEVNVGPRMRDSDSIGSVTAVESIEGVTISDVSHTTGIIRFLVSGGSPGQVYPIRMRWSVPSEPPQSLEALVYLVVRAE